MRDYLLAAWMSLGVFAAVVLGYVLGCRDEARRSLDRIRRHRDELGT